MCLKLESYQFGVLQRSLLGLVLDCLCCVPCASHGCSEGSWLVPGRAGEPWGWWWLVGPAPCMALLPPPKVCCWIEHTPGVAFKKSSTNWKEIGPVLDVPTPGMVLSLAPSGHLLQPVDPVSKQVLGLNKR